MKPKLLAILILIFFISNISFASDIEALKENLKKFYLLEQIEESEIEFLLNSMEKDYSYKDIDYNTHRRSNWTPRTHLKRLIKLAIAFENNASSYYKSPKLAETIVGSLNYWSYNKFYSDNWWQGQIGIPQTIGPTLIMCESIIPDSTMTKSLEIMDQSKIGMTGQNKIWLSGNVFMRELLRKNDSLIELSATTIKSVLVPSKPYEEGIQPDFSFHQHGPQPQFGNYGLHFAEDIIKWMYIFNNTEIAFSSQKVDLMRNLMFEGQQKVIYKGKYEVLATGRQLFPEMVNGKKYRGPASKADLYKNLEGIFKEFDSKNTPISAPYEYIHFRNSDYSLYRTKDFFSSVRMSSKRVIGAEAGNGENQMGYYLGDGTNLIYRTGNEYHEIYPVWNWKKLPGTTIVQDTAALPKLTWDGYRNNSDFTGGLKSKHIGITAFSYNRDSLHAHKSYFFIDNMIYAIGSGISSQRNFEVVTTLNQCYKNGTISIKKKNDKISYILHDSIAYASLTDDKLLLSDSIQTGNWKKIITWHDDIPISSEIVNIGINHGKKPTNEKYAYVSIVGVNENQVRKILKKDLGKLVHHTENAHALYLDNGNLIAIAAFKPCEVKIAKRKKIKIVQPCLVILEKVNFGWKIDAVDPTQKLEKLSFEMDGNYGSNNSNKIQVSDNKTTFDVILPFKPENRGMKSSIELIKK